MLALLIETSTERGIVALHDGKTSIKQIDLPFGYNNSKLLLPVIEEILGSTGKSMQDLTLVAGGIGPGSYTGIRVGAVVAKSIAFALKIPLVGVCSLEGFVPDNESIADKYVAMIDAKIGGVYVLVKGFEPCVKPLDALEELVESVKYAVTPTCDALKTKIDNLYPQNRIQWIERYPSAEALFKSAFQKLDQGDISKDYQLELMYLRKTQAEIEREKGRKGKGT